MKKSPDNSGQVGLILGILAITLVVMLALFIPAGPRRACLKSQITLDDARTELDRQKLARDDEADRLARQKQLMEILAKRPAGVGTLPDPGGPVAIAWTEGSAFAFRPPPGRV